MSISNSGSLGDLQRNFQDYIFALSDEFVGAIRSTTKADRTTLLQVYRDAYALRLIEVLTNDYPGLLALLGPAAFDRMARAYIAAHPSHHPSARWFGAKLPDFLKKYTACDVPAAEEMARFEWLLGEGFDAADAKPVRAEELMALPPEAWNELTLRPLPSVRRIALAFAVPRAWQQREDLEAGKLQAEMETAPVEWIIWRPDLVANYRSLDADEAAIFDTLVEGRGFPEICAAALPFTGEEGAPARAAGLLRAWVEEGLIASYHFPGKSEPAQGPES